MLRKTLVLAVATLLVTLATASQAQAWGCIRAGGFRGAYGGGYRASYTHYGPVTGFQHGSVGGGYGAYGGYHYDTHYGGYGGYAAGAYRRY